MTAVIIICAVFLFPLVLLLIPVSADMIYRDSFSVSVKYGGIKVFDNSKPKKESKAQKTESKKEEISKKPKKENLISKLFKEKGKIEGIKFCFSFIKIAFSKIIWVIRKIKIKKLCLEVSVASDNAASTAIGYGAVCAAVYPTLNLINQNTEIGIKEINIYTDFDKLSPEIKISFSAKTRLVYAVVSAVALLFAYLRLKKESDKNGRKQSK